MCCLQRCSLARWTPGLSPIQENPQSPIQRHKTSTSTKPSWNPNFMRTGDQTSFHPRKQAPSLPKRVATKKLAAASSKTHSRKTSSDAETIWAENNSTHTRNTSVSDISSSSETLFTENGSTHARNTSLSEARSLEECEKARETADDATNTVETIARGGTLVGLNPCPRAICRGKTEWCAEANEALRESMTLFCFLVRFGIFRQNGHIVEQHAEENFGHCGNTWWINRVNTLVSFTTN